MPGPWKIAPAAEAAGADADLDSADATVFAGTVSTAGGIMSLTVPDGETNTTGAITGLPYGLAFDLGAVSGPSVVAYGLEWSQQVDSTNVIVGCQASSTPADISALSASHFHQIRNGNASNGISTFANKEGSNSIATINAEGRADSEGFSGGFLIDDTGVRSSVYTHTYTAGSIDRTNTTDVAGTGNAWFFILWASNATISGAQTIKFAVRAKLVQADSV